MRSFVKIELSRNGDITLSFTDLGESCHIREFLTSQICLLTLFAKANSRENFRIYSMYMYKLMFIYHNFFYVA